MKSSRWIGPTGLALRSSLSLVILAIVSAGGARLRAQASGALHASARVTRAEAGAPLLLAARSLADSARGPAVLRRDLTLATVTVQPAWSGGGSTGRGSPIPAPIETRRSSLLPRIVSIQFLRN